MSVASIDASHLLTKAFECISFNFIMRVWYGACFPLSARSIPVLLDDEECLEGFQGFVCRGTTLGSLGRDTATAALVGWRA